MGTVDYIWHTERLRPLRVLDILPVEALRRTGGQDVFDFMDEDEEEDFWDFDWDYGPSRGQQQQQQRPRKDQGRRRQSSRWVRVDWIEGPDAHTFKIDLPGVKKEQLNVRIEDTRTLVITGERPKEKPDKGERVRLMEREGGSFVRKYRLPKTAKPDEVKAHMEDGVLIVTVPKEKQPETKPEVKTIEIQTGTPHESSVPVASGAAGGGGSEKMQEGPSQPAIGTTGTAGTAGTAA